MATALHLSLSSSFLPSPLPKITTATTNPLRKLISVATTAASPPSTFKKRHYKAGRYPGLIETSAPHFSRETSNSKYKRRTTHNSNKRNNNNNSIIKKKMDNKGGGSYAAKATAFTVSEAFFEAIETKQWLRALQIFEMLKEQPFYQPKETTYKKLLVLLGRSGQPGQACRLFDEMVQEGIEPTSELYTTLLAACCRSNLIDKAFSVLEQMKSLSFCQPDEHTYSILIKACVDASRFELLESLYNQMDERLITPSTATQNIVVNGYGKAGKYEEMEKVVHRMVESQTSQPDVRTMNAVLSLFGNEGEVEMMERWYEIFLGYGIEPESRTFNILIGAYVKKKMYDKMSSVMEYMRRLSFPWTTATYNSVIEAFSDTADAKHMEYTFEQMRAEGIKTDIKTLCYLIKGYANAGIFHKVISTVQLAGRLGIPENTSFFNAVIYACSKADDLTEMERVFKKMKTKQCQPDSMTYSVMMDAYRREGMSDKVYDLEQEMQLVLAAKVSKEAYETHSDDVSEASMV